MLKIYLIILIFISFFICLFITYEIYNILDDHSYINAKSLKKEINTLLISQVYMKQKKWIESILLLENNIVQKNELEVKSYKFLGFCYDNIKVYHLSEYYYNKAAQKDTYNTILLYKLAQAYKSNNKTQEAVKIYKQILTIDKNNILAKKQLKILNT
uniref:Uncharacterized protein n=1 Tax=Dicranema revolutum TaxID=239144 RepID=A0A4D6WRE9_9FLOR|nr:hypothetical protein [Dicranema revolutum]